MGKKEQDPYRRKVNRNTAVLISLAVVFLGVGTLRYVYGHSLDGFSSKVCNEDRDNRTQRECQDFYHIQEVQYAEIGNSDALFCYTICVLALVGGSIYRSHALEGE